MADEPEKTSEGNQPGEARELIVRHVPAPGFISGNVSGATLSGPLPNGMYQLNLYRDSMFVGQERGEVHPPENPDDPNIRVTLHIDDSSVVPLREDVARLYLSAKDLKSIGQMIYNQMENNDE